MFIGRNSQHICARTHVTIARTCVHKAARATGRAPGVTAGAGCDVPMPFVILGMFMLYVF